MTPNDGHCRHETRFARLANWEGIKKVGFVFASIQSFVHKGIHCVWENVRLEEGHFEGEKNEQIKR